MKHLYMEQDYSKQYSKSQHSYLPIALFLTMVCAFFLLDAVLPLQDLMFPDALLTHLGKWPLSPAHVLFPRFPVVQMRIDKHVPAVIMLARSWKETGLLFGVFLGLFGLYLLALRPPAPPRAERCCVRLWIASTGTLAAALSRFRSRAAYRVPCDARARPRPSSPRGP